MSVLATPTEVAEALRRIGRMLEPDGFELLIDVEGGRVRADVVATTATCTDCLVPKDLLASLLLDRLHEVGIEAAPGDIDLHYPDN